MSDDLVKRLRSFDCITMDGCGRELRHEAVDRIEELEGKLAKAVEMLDRLSFARTTLAELKEEDRG
jgi:hypothetical protein